MTRCRRAIRISTDAGELCSGCLFSVTFRTTGRGRFMTSLTETFDFRKWRCLNGINWFDWLHLLFRRTGNHRMRLNGWLRRRRIVSFFLNQLHSRIGAMPVGRRVEWKLARSLLFRLRGGMRGRGRMRGRGCRWWHRRWQLFLWLDLSVDIGRRAGVGAGPLELRNLRIWWRCHRGRGRGRSRGRK